MGSRIRMLVVGAAAVVVAGLAAPAATAAPPGIVGGAQASWVFDSGPIAPGVSENHNWKVPDGQEAYQVSLSPYGALVGKPCQFEVTRLWYVQLKDNLGRRVWWTVKNVGSQTCGTSMLLTGNPKHQSFTQSALDPGQTWNTVWNINSGVWSVGLSPTGATSTKDCAMEVTRTWQLTNATKRQLWMTLKNVGTIPCGTTVIMTRTTADVTQLTPPIAKSDTYTNALPNVSPTVGYWFGVPPVLMTYCKLEVTRDFWEQRINSDLIAERRFHYWVKNLDSEDPYCVGNLVIDKVTG